MFQGPLAVSMRQMALMPHRARVEVRLQAAICKRHRPLKYKLPESVCGGLPRKRFALLAMTQARSPINTSGMTEFDLNFVQVARDGVPQFCQSRFGIIFSLKNDYQIEDPRHRKLFLLQKQRGCRDRLEAIIGAVTRQDP